MAVELVYDGQKADPQFDPNNAEPVVVPEVQERPKLNLLENLEIRMRQAEGQSDSNWPLR